MKERVGAGRWVRRWLRLDCPGSTFALIRGGGEVGKRVALVAGVGWRGGALVFFLVESRSNAPMLPLVCFRSRAFSGPSMTLCLVRALVGGVYFLPLELIEVQHYTVRCGGCTASAILWFFCLVALVGCCCEVWRAAAAYCGPLIAELGFGLLTRGAAGGAYWVGVLPAVMCAWFGTGVSVAPLRQR